MVKFNSLENKVVSCGDDSLLKVWDIGKIKKCTSLKGHTQSISAFKFADNE
jgi:WD40 repeat protein